MLCPPIIFHGLFSQVLDKMTRKFWWKGSGKNNRFLASIGWNHLCRPKRSGGLGFRKFEDMNLALLSKLGWNMAARSPLRWVEVLHKKYCASGNFFDVNPNSYQSKGWNDIMATREIIIANSCFLVGSGKRVKQIWG